MFFLLTNLFHCPHEWAICFLKTLSDTVDELRVFAFVESKKLEDVLVLIKKKYSTEKYCYRKTYELPN